MPVTNSAPHVQSARRDDMIGWLVDGWRLAIRHFPAMMVIALIADIPLLIAAHAADRVNGGLTRVVLGFPLIATITPIAKAASIWAASRWEQGQPATPVGAWTAVFKRFVVVLAGCLVWTIAVFAGVALLVLPGIVLLIGGQCFMGALMVDRLSLPDAARRSWSLVRPKFFEVFALFLVVQAVAGIVGAIMTTILEAAFGSTGWPATAVDLVSRSLTSPLVYGPLAMMFLRRAAATPSATAP
jgi:hypothetical protein